MNRLSLLAPLVVTCTVWIVARDLPAQPKATAKPLAPFNLAALNTKADEDDPYVSRDGMRLLYTSNASGHYTLLSTQQRIRIQFFPGSERWPAGTELEGQNTDFDNCSPYLTADSHDLYYAEKDEEAIALARRVVARDPRIFSAWTALAGSLERTGNGLAAVRALREGISQSSAETPPEQLSQAYDDLARLFKQAGDSRGREQALRDAVARGVVSEAARRDLARIYLGSGRAGDAIGLLRSASVQEAESLEVLGVALAAAGKNDEARETLLRASAAAPGNARIALNLGILALHRSDFRDARDWFSKSIQLKPGDPAALAELGLAQAALGDEASAAESWGKALELDPRQCDALYNLAVLELKKGNTQQGRVRLEYFVASAPRNRYAKELEEARRLLQKLGRP